MEQPGQYYRINPQVSVRLMGERGAVLFDPDTGRERVLNVTGLFLWKRLDGTRSLEGLAGDLCHAFSGVPSDRVVQDVGAFCTDLSKQGFLALQDKKAPAPVRETAYPDVLDAPTSLDISLTGRCNLHCSYCFYADEMKYRPDLPVEEWVAFFGELRSLAVRDVCLSGGEAFVRPELWDLIDAVMENRMRYSLLSNGTLITEKTLERFENGLRRSRLTSIQVSIDGSCAEVHDRSRGDGSFVKAVMGLRLLKEAGFPVTCRVTINRYNVDDLENIARFLLEDVGLDSFGTNDAMPMGAGCNNQESIVLTPGQRVSAMKRLARLSARYNGRITAQAGPLAQWRAYREMDHARETGEMTRRWQMGYLTACGCMYNKLSVHHDGMITPCNMLSHLEMGRINRDPLREIWRTHPTLQALKDRRKIPMEQVPGCEDCEWAPFCNGGCPGLVHDMTGDFNRADPHDCYKRFLESTGLTGMKDLDNRSA